MGILSDVFGGTDEKGMTQADYDRAALRKIGLPFLSKFFGGEPPATTENARKRIAERREWAKSLEDARWRSAYRRWIDYAERCCDEAENAYRNRDKDRAKQERFRQELMAENRRINELSDDQPIPPR